jgi:hypothetical protein
LVGNQSVYARVVVGLSGSIFKIPGVSICFSKTLVDSGFPSNQRHLIPRFQDALEKPGPVSVLYDGASILSQTAEMRMELAYFPEITRPKKTTVYGRRYSGHGLFFPLSTSYGLASNELVAQISDFGEFIFAEPDIQTTLFAPIQVGPANGKKMLPLDTLTLRWTGKGSYDSFHLQVSIDSTFGTILVADTVNLSIYKMEHLLNKKKYFWRLRSFYGKQASEWTSVWRFETTDPFVSVSFSQMRKMILMK